MSDLTKLTISEALEQLNNGSMSSRELVEAHIKAIEDARSLNAYIEETPERAIEGAIASDKHRAVGVIGKLEGIPVAIKDLFCTEGIKTTAGSKMLAGFIPPYESTVTANMWREGAVMLGKTNLDEFAMGSSNETSYFGPVKNPHSNGQTVVPGGSSGGSAAAVAAHTCLGATGTDTGGSIRQPAAFCGLVGIKPTYGRCSRWGIIAFASSLDQAGPMTRSVRDAAIMLEAMAGFDSKDSTSVKKAVPKFEEMIGRSVKGLRVGIPREYDIEGMSDEIRILWHEGIEWLKDAGAKIINVSLPHTEAALPAYYIIAPAEASSNLARYDGVRYGHRIDSDDLHEMYSLTRSDGFGDEVKRRILIGTYVLSDGYYDAYYLKAQKVRSLIAQDFKEAFDKCDVLLTPTTPSEAFAMDANKDPLEMYLNDVMCVPASLAGLPAISVPVGFSKNKLPLGLQLIGKSFDEETVFKAAEILERSSGF